LIDSIRLLRDACFAPALYIMIRLYFSLVITLLPSGALADDWFDAHLHYNADQVETFSPKQIIDTLNSNQVSKAVVTSRPPELVMKLYQQEPGRIVPMLGLYTKPDDKTRWLNDRQLPARLRQQLDQHSWAAIGELHLFANDRNKPVFRQIVEIARSRMIPLLIHADPAVIDTLYSISPRQPVIWAHAGKYPYTDLIADYLERYPALHIDLSMRDDRIAPDGPIADDWYELIVTNPDRFMVGVDTYSTARWRTFSEATTKIRHWLSQLPPDIAGKLAYKNANRIYKQDKDSDSEE